MSEEMIKKMNEEVEDLERIKLAEGCGLVYTGKTEDGELEFVGTGKQFREYWERAENNNLI